MSWPGGAEPFPDSSAQGDRPTDLASLGRFSRTGHLLGFSRNQVEQTLKLLSGPFEDLPQVPPFAPLFGYTTTWHKMMVAQMILEIAGHANRLPTPEEADAIAYYRSKFCSRAAWAPPAVLLTTAYFFNRGRPTFRFPFYTPKPASFNPSYFPSASRPFLRGVSAVRFWHVLRFGAYGLICQILVKPVVVSYANATSLVGMLRDDRLKLLRQNPHRNQEHQHPVATQPPNESGEQWQQQLGNLQQQPAEQQPTWKQTSQEPQEPQGGLQDDESFLFDDASPVAPSQWQQPQRASASSPPPPGSAWDRIRQRAKSEEGTAWNQGDQQNGDSQTRSRTEQYTYSPDEREKASLTTTAVSKTGKTALVITSFPSVPLTTTFTRPSSDCGALYSPRSPPLYVIDNEPSCLPAGFSTSNSAFFYSPGIACPSGYWTACHDTTGVSTITTVTCCPTYGDISLSCVPDPLSLSEVWETLFCTWIAPQSTGTVVTVTKSVDGRTSTVTEPVTWPGGINAYGVRMVHQSTDRKTPSTTATSASNDSPKTLSTSTTSASLDPSSSNSSTPGNTDFPTGAKAAIGVVVPLVVLGALLAALLFWRRKRKQQQQGQPLSPPLDHHHQQQPQQYYDHHGSPPPAGAEHYPLGDQLPKPPGGGNGYYYYGNIPPQPPPQEMPGAWENATELPNTRMAAELPGNARWAGR
ncbi:hypothetical protein N657DRAFT_653516 [Parathielavia appendiculata]|uniref:Uncharacterized protein n=1 Tax=Parathielavia appendiculata TaxID=2587402 RepID=A0AAN6U692_9PEZI|nr:hypothetical protein N657DRAFT_653516 [Parathielavia appendiculata]